MLNDKFERSDINRYLYEVAKLFKKQCRNKNAEAEIILVGGAAMLLRYTFRSTTMDIDAVIKAPSYFKDSVNTVGDMYGLPNGWLNSDFLVTASYSNKINECSKYYKTFCNVLQVRLVEAEYLIAMKLTSSRLYKDDLSDIVGIIKEHEELGNPISFEKINRAVNELYGGWEHIKEESKSFIKNVLSSDDLETLYYEVYDEENHNRDMLIMAEEKYSDVIKADNVESFIKAFRKSDGKERESVIDKLRKNQEKANNAPKENVREIQEQTK